MIGPNSRAEADALVSLKKHRLPRIALMVAIAPH